MEADEKGKGKEGEKEEGKEEEKEGKEDEERRKKEEEEKRKRNEEEEKEAQRKREQEKEEKKREEHQKRVERERKIFEETREFGFTLDGKRRSLASQVEKKKDDPQYSRGTIVGTLRFNFPPALDRVRKALEEMGFDSQAIDLSIAPGLESSGNVIVMRSYIEPSSFSGPYTRMANNFPVLTRCSSKKDGSGWSLKYPIESE